MNEISYMSLCLYDKEKGFLFGKNRQGKYDIPIEKIGKDDIDVVDVLVRLLIREYVLYESFYFQRRCKKMVKDSYSVDVLKEMMEEIRTKYENGNGWYQYEYVYMECVFKQIVYEWLKNYAHMDFDIELENGSWNRMVIIDISHLLENKVLAAIHQKRKYQENIGILDLLKNKKELCDYLINNKDFDSLFWNKDNKNNIVFFL
jgi:hypothetical protein